MKKYPRISELRKKGPTPTKAQIGEIMTQPGQALSLKDVIKQSLNGFPLPMTRSEIELHPDLNQVLQGTQYDIPSDAKFKSMSKVQRATLMNNIQGLKQQLNEKIGEELSRKQELQKAIENTPTPEPKPAPTPEPTPST